MNEKIKELIAQASRWVYCDTDEDSSYELDADMFAALIVQECISINRQRLFSDYEGDSHRVAHNNALLCATSDMFEHFGVEDGK